MQGVFNKIRKLRKMPLAEIRSRVTSKLRSRRERKQWRSLERPSPDVTTDFPSVLNNAHDMVRGASVREVQKLQQHAPSAFAEFHARIDKEYRSIVAGNWRALGHDFNVPDARHDWHHDPRTSYRWPQAFYADIALYELPGGLDVKYIWELGRQQYVTYLGQQWLFSVATQNEEQTAAELAVALVHSWIDQNPLYEGVHWTSGLEVAMRSISWIWMLATLSEWQGWTSSHVKTITQSLAQHGSYLEHHLSYFSSPYNHLIGEATALYWIGLAINRGAVADRWKSLGRDVLTEHGPRQFYEDGFCVEQATGYHFYTLGFLLLAIHAGQVDQHPLTELESVCLQAARTGQSMRQPDGRWPAIGDVDSARSMPVPAADFWAFDSLCSLAGALLQAPDLTTSDGPSAETFWLLGSRGQQKLDSLRDKSRKQANADIRTWSLTTSGYAIAGSPTEHVILDAGPIAAGLHADATPSTAHGHNDALSVLYYGTSGPLLHDAGIHTYNEQPAWSEFLRSPQAHNTITIEGLTTAKAAGPLMWCHVTPQAQLVSEGFDGESWQAVGELRWSSDCSVRRTVRWMPDTSLEIIDEINVDRQRNANWYWHVPFGTFDQQQELSSCHTAMFGKQWRCEIQSFSEDELKSVRRQSASCEDPTGWVATGYGELQRADRIQCTASVSGQATFHTRFERVGL